MAETKKVPSMALDAFVESYGPKYDKAVDCLTKDSDTFSRSTTSPPNTGSTCEQRTD